MYPPDTLGAKIEKRLKWMTEMRDHHKELFDQNRNDYNEFVLYQRYVEGVEQLEWILREIKFENYIGVK